MIVRLKGLITRDEARKLLFFLNLTGAKLKVILEWPGGVAVEDADLAEKFVSGNCTNRNLLFFLMTLSAHTASFF